MLSELIGVVVRPRRDASLVRANEAPELVGDASRLRGLTGWQPSVPLRQTLTDLVTSIEAGSRADIRPLTDRAAPPRPLHSGLVAIPGTVCLTVQTQQLSIGRQVRDQAMASMVTPWGSGRRDDVGDADNRAFRLGAGEGRRIWAFGDLMIIKLTAEQSSGRVFVMEQHVPRHQGAPGRHVHEVDDQSWFVIAGRGRWFIGDQTIEAGPGDFVHGPHGVAHAFCADTDDLHVLVITAPAGLEGLFAAMGVEATEPTHPPADLPEPPDDPDLARRYGTTALGPEPSWTPQDVHAS